MIQRLLFSLVTFSILLNATPRCLAAGEDPVSTALPAAQAWLGQIDAGLYVESYSAGGEGLHEQITQDKWVLALKTLRPAWGQMISRKEVSHFYQPNGIQGLAGECIGIAYDTTFSKMPEAREVVIMRFEDGKWRGVGYTFGTKASSETSSQYQQPVTETSSSTVHAGQGDSTSGGNK